MFEFSEMRALAGRLEQFVNGGHTEAFMRECLIELAKKLWKKTKNKTPFNTGLLRNTWQIGTISKIGDIYEIEVYNDTEYAEFVEHGFKAHWVPGRWEGHQFIYDPKERKSGMFVGKPGTYVEGKFMLKLSEQELEREMERFLQRKQEQFLRKMLGGD
ncbi:HK97 gp10 family phage protein [Metasolibacillus meyeri]|uniref:HK97 gp10 family phage protein n=1 Tax=Metasolibacillus meyeri TaxID=1071052 RepID=A0AAW9NW57_9BACL|nr:HK97 gp10 family phage protein [Metasolibacillus meyeri]MEC1178538.1 HK97 gp10 family phage protein [Metasolibacillus meyeri]